MDDGLGRVVGGRTPRQALGTRVIGEKLFVYDIVTSTNDLAHFLAQAGEPEGSDGRPRSSRKDLGIAGRRRALFFLHPEA
jgi:hypothetical protein